MTMTDTGAWWQNATTTHYYDGNPIRDRVTPRFAAALLSRNHHKVSTAEREDTFRTLSLACALANYGEDV